MQVRAKRFVWAIGVLAATVWACETARNPGGIQRDLVPPSITLAAADTEQIANGLQLTVTAGDNLGLKEIQLTYSGGYTATFDTVFTSTVTSVTLSELTTFPATSGAGGPITIVGRATDGAGNFTEDTIGIFLSNVQALRVTLLQPITGDAASTGKYVPIQVIAIQKSGIQTIGWTISPAGQTAQFKDSVFNGAAPFPDSVEFVDSVKVTGTVGTFTIVGFAVDSAGRRVPSNSATITILSAANDLTPPEIEQFVATRAEATDSVTVHATDPSGISVIGFQVTDVTDTTIVYESDTVFLPGTSSSATLTFNMNLPVAPPAKVIVRAFACDSAVAHNCGVTGRTFTVPSPTGPFRADTILIVAGRTHLLPQGGHIADAIFNTNRRELYLTNDALGRVEVFSLATGTFDSAGIQSAGPTPTGIALWPVDTVGHYDNNKVVVADAGGTELSILDASTRLLLWRQNLPNYLIEKYTVITTPFARPLIIVHDVSDRPQYVGTVCRVGNTPPNCAPDSIYAIYSTTPTVSSSSPFSGKATLRMEKLINSTNPDSLFGHLFWELGALGTNVQGDTLRIESVRGTQRQVLLTACARVTIDFETFGLGDQTFTRNSGNFTHALIGEGGNITTAFARVFAYSAKQALKAGAATDTTCELVTGFPEGGHRDVDLGMSPGEHVSDFIANTGLHLVSIATNFNGLTNLVRADSIYVLGQDLRLKGLMQIGSGTPGMDMNYNHNFDPEAGCTTTCGGGSGSINNRMVFAASPDTSILVFDTYFFDQQTRIQIRDPIVGPLRVSLDTTGTGQQYLFAITTRGLVQVTLPAITNTHVQTAPVPTVSVTRRLSGSGTRIQKAIKGQTPARVRKR